MSLSQISFLLLVILLYTFQNFFCKKFSHTYSGRVKDSTPVLTIIGGIVVIAVTFFFAKFRFSAQPITIILGFINAAALYFYNDFLLKGSLCGPYSVMTVFAMFGVIAMPAVIKWIGFGDKITSTTICFIIFIMVAICLMSNKPSDENEVATNKMTLKFLLFSFGLFVCNGSYASILAVQQELTGEGEKEELIIVTFAAATIISIMKLVTSKVSLKNVMKMSGEAFCNLMIYAFCAAFAVNSLVIIFLLDINAAVLLTVQNAGVMLLSIVFSVIFFKEKLTKMNVVGCILIAIGLVGITVFENYTFSKALQMISNLIK